MPVRDVIFDLDGTLVDSAPGIAFSVAAAMAAVLPGYRAPDIRPHIGPPIREVMRLALRATMGELSRDILDRLDAAFRLSYDADGWTRTVPFDGAVQTVAALASAGVRCFIATNKPALSANLILGRLGFASHLAGVVCRDSKTPPFTSKAQAVASLIERHKIDPSRALLVGDAPDDAEAAAANGVAFCAAVHGYGGLVGGTPPATRWVATLSALPPLVLGEEAAEFTPARIHEGRP